jgi:hypothetical protein
MEEVVQFEHAPHPVEFKMYYSSWFIFQSLIIKKT